MTDEISREELEGRLWRLREANRMHDRGQPTWEQWIERNNEIVPGLGDMLKNRHGATKNKGPSLP